MMKSLKIRAIVSGFQAQGMVRWVSSYKSAVVLLLALTLALGAQNAQAKKKSASAPSGKSSSTAADATASERLGANAPPEVKAVLDKVEEVQSTVMDVQMDLRMQVKDSVSGQKQSVRGQVEMKSPDKVFVHYTKPTEQYLYINGNALLMYQPDQAMVYKQSAAKGQPVYLGVGKQLKMYSNTSRVSIIKESGSEVVLLFVPDGGNAQFERMRVTVRKSDWWPGKVEIESSSMTSVAEFLKPVYNQGLKDSIFKFTPPAGVNVVEGEIF
jgi:outer membrane lipoprotein-sorting protein